MSRCQLAFSDDLGRRIVFSAYANFAGAVTCFRNASAPAWRRSTPNMNLPGIFLLRFCVIASFPRFFIAHPFVSISLSLDVLGGRFVEFQGWERAWIFEKMNIFLFFFFDEEAELKLLLK